MKATLARTPQLQGEIPTITLYVERKSLLEASICEGSSYYEHQVMEEMLTIIAHFLRNSLLQFSM